MMAYSAIGIYVNLIFRDRMKLSEFPGELQEEIKTAYEEKYGEMPASKI